MMDDPRTKMIATLKTSHRLAMFNLLIWFFAGALEINGSPLTRFTIRGIDPVLLTGFIYALGCQFYFYAKMRSEVRSREL